jgi:deoxycytidylate deaminase
LDAARQLTTKDHTWYTLALKLASESECKSRHGCVIVKSGKPVSVAVNRLVSHPLGEQFNKRSIHAEQRALIKSNTPLHGATLYSARDHANHSSEPCEMCRELIQDSGIKYVVYWHSMEGLVKIRVR